MAVRSPCACHPWHWVRLHMLAPAMSPFTKRNHRKRVARVNRVSAHLKVFQCRGTEHSETKKTYTYNHLGMGPLHIYSQGLVAAERICFPSLGSRNKNIRCLQKPLVLGRWWQAAVQMQLQMTSFSAMARRANLMMTPLFPVRSRNAYLRRTRAHDFGR